MKILSIIWFSSLLLIASVVAIPTTYAQEDTPGNNDQAQSPESDQENQPQAVAHITIAGSNQVLVGKSVTFHTDESEIPEGTNVREVLWNFGDGVRTTGTQVTHEYKRPGSYTVSTTITTEDGQTAEDTSEVTVFEHALVLITDQSVPAEKLELNRQQAANEDLLLLNLQPRTTGSEVLIEEDLTNQLLDARDTLAKSNLLITWTSGNIGPGVLSRFAQHIRQAEGITFADINMSTKGIIIMSDTPFGVMAPSAQSAFDQLSPSFVLLTRPTALDLLLQPLTGNEAKEAIFNSPLQHRLLGTFSSRTVSDISPTNFVSFGINFLVNHGVPISSITLILMLPVIATILSFSRQVIGIKAFGLITPAMSALSFLVVGLQYGLIIFSAILLSGTLTRLLMRKLHLLYLPRMALVLTSVSLAILAIFGIGIALGQTTLLSFSVFPILILTLLAEEFIALQFKSGPRQALVITSWTLALAILCYYIVSWELLRTIIISYPEVVLLAIPANILLGRWTGLRLSEYFRFRKLLRYVQS